MPRGVAGQAGRRFGQRLPRQLRRLHRYIRATHVLGVLAVAFRLLPGAVADSSAGEQLSSERAARLGRPLIIRSTRGVHRTREQNARVFIMLEEEHDPSCQAAAQMFDRASMMWAEGDNVTFARIDIGLAPDAPGALGLTSALSEGGLPLPQYVLAMQGLATPIRYSGGWSESSLSAWLHRQIALAPTEADGLEAIARQVRSESSRGVVVVGLLTERQRERRLLEVAARAADVQGGLALGGEQLAAQMGVTVPCIVVVKRDSDTWPVLRPPLMQAAVEQFLWALALPAVVPIGDQQRAFARQVREHPYRYQVVLIHRSGTNRPDEDSNRALVQLRKVAAMPELQQFALFLTYDFFDNDPEQFTMHGILASELPTVVVYHDRGNFGETRWRQPLNDGSSIDAAGIERLLRGAKRDVDGRATQKNPESRTTWEWLPPPEAYGQIMEACSPPEQL